MAKNFKDFGGAKIMSMTATTVTFDSTPVPNLPDTYPFDMGVWRAKERLFIEDETRRMISITSNVSGNEYNYTSETAFAELLPGEEYWAFNAANAELLGSIPSLLSDLSNVSTTSPSGGQVLKFDGSNWGPGTDNTGPTPPSPTFQAVLPGSHSPTISSSDDYSLIVLEGSSQLTATLPDNSSSSFLREGFWCAIQNNTTQRAIIAPHDSAATINGVTGNSFIVAGGFAYYVNEGSNIWIAMTAQNNPAGGNINEVLAKKSGDDQDTEWKTPASVVGGADLDDINNVSNTTPTDGQILSYNSTTSVWEPKTGGGGAAGTDGDTGWSPELAVKSDSNRRVFQIDDWVGGTGTKPSGTGEYIGASGLETNIANGVNIRGPAGATGSAGAQGPKGDKGDKGDTGDTGPAGAAGAAGADGTNGADGAAGLNGDDGWTPVFAIVSSGNRRVLQVSDWTGGAGTKPTTGQYVGSSGFVTAIADAIDIRGPQGQSGGGGGGGSGTPTYNGITEYNTDYTVTVDDDYKVIELIGSSSITITMPDVSAGAVTTIRDGFFVTIHNDTTETCYTAPHNSANDTINGANGNHAIAASGFAIMIKEADNKWIALDAYNVPSGGSENEVLYKASGADFDYAWGELGDLASDSTGGIYLDSIADVANSPFPTGGDVLTYDGTNFNWKPQAPSGGGGFTPPTISTGDAGKAIGVDDAETGWSLRGKTVGDRLSVNLGSNPPILISTSGVNFNLPLKAGSTTERYTFEDVYMFHFLFFNSSTLSGITSSTQRSFQEMPGWMFTIADYGKSATTALTYLANTTTAGNQIYYWNTGVAASSVITVAGRGNIGYIHKMWVTLYG